MPKKPSSETTKPRSRNPDRGASLLLKLLVPKRGLEPPHPCEYMDLNHARLPIPPLRHGIIRSFKTRLAASSSVANACRGVKAGMPRMQARNCLVALLDGSRATR